MYACMRSFADFLMIYYRGGEIWVKEKVQPLKIINALFLEPHIRCSYNKSIPSGMLLSSEALRIRCWDFSPVA